MGMRYGEQNMAEILIVDDLEFNRILLEEIISRMGFRPVLAESGEEALAAIGKSLPVLVLSDISMPGMDGYELCRAIKSDKKTRHIPVIFISANDTTEDVVEGFGLGGADYITKPFNILEIKARIKAIMRRTGRPEKGTQGKIVEASELRMDLESRRLFIAGKEINLTAKEFDLLELMALNPGKVYGRESLLNTVWGYEYPGDVRTVDVHIRRLREKIETNPSEPKYVHTKWGVGYYFQA